MEPIIGAYPTFIFYMKGQVVHRMQGFDVTELRTRVNNFTRLLPSSFFMSSINDIDEDEDDFYEYDDGPDHCAPEKPKVNSNISSNSEEVFSLIAFICSLGRSEAPVRNC